MKKPLTPEERASIEAMRAAAATGTLYDLLGLPPSCRGEEVEAAYREHARRWHPDRYYSRDTGELALVIDENFANATRAYQVLKDTFKRSEYDRELISSGRMPTSAPSEAPDDDDHQVAYSPGTRPVSIPSFPPRSSPSGPARPGSDPPYGSPPPRAPTGSPPPPTPPQRTATPTPPWAPPRAPTPPPPPPKPKAPAAIQKIQAALAEQLGRARSYFETGKADFAVGNFAKAEGALYLATKFDPKNEEYARLWKEASAKAGQQRAAVYVEQAQNAEMAMRPREAMQLLQKAIDCDPPDGRAYYMLARILRSQEEDTRGALNHLRKAAMKEPRNVEYRLALADAYAGQGMQVNALREVQVALEIEPKNERAKALLKTLRR